MNKILIHCLIISLLLIPTKFARADLNKELQSTVLIACVENKQIVSSGSGTRIKGDKDTKHQYLTADHVAECNGQLYNINERKPVKVVKRDGHHDLAVLETLSTISDNKPVLLIASSDPNVGEDVYAIGYPGPDVELMITKGVVSAYRWQTDFYLGKLVRKMLKTDAEIYPGNSGGPLINSRGELVGVCHGAFSSPEHAYLIGYFTPASDVIKFLIS